MCVTNRTMARDILSEQQCNIEFVKTVEKFPCLYNFELPAYSRKDLIDKAWEEVADATNMSPPACRERWRNLRAVFMRTVKATGAGTKKKQYYLADVMQFVVPFLRPTSMTEAEKQKMLNLEFGRSETLRPKDFDQPPVEMGLEDIKIEIDEDTGQSSSDWGGETFTSSRKRTQESEEYYSIPSKRRSVFQSSNVSTQVALSTSICEMSDPVISFVNSLLPELQEMNTAQFKSFKRRVLVLIDDITTQIPSAPKDNEYD